MKVSATRYVHAADARPRRESWARHFPLSWIKGQTWEVQADDPTFCCDEMSAAWGESFVKFGSMDSQLNRDERVNIFQCSPYAEGAVFNECAISFCPFCGDKIEVKIEEVEKLIK